MHIHTTVSSKPMMKNNYHSHRKSLEMDRKSKEKSPNKQESESCQKKFPKSYNPYASSYMLYWPEMEMGVTLLADYFLFLFSQEDWHPTPLISIVGKPVGSICICSGTSIINVELLQLGWFCFNLACLFSVVNSVAKSNTIEVTKCLHTVPVVSFKCL